MFDNQLNMTPESTSEQEPKKTSLFTTFTDEEIAAMQSGKTVEEKKEEIEEFKDNGFASANPYYMLRSRIESILNSKEYESILVNMVDAILLEEQNALNDETKKKVKLKKFMLGLAFTSCNCYGDQQNFLYLMADRLGVRR